MGLGWRCWSWFQMDTKMGWKGWNGFPENWSCFWHYQRWRYLELWRSYFRWNQSWYRTGDLKLLIVFVWPLMTKQSEIHNLNHFEGLWIHNLSNRKWFLDTISRTLFRLGQTWNNSKTLGSKWQRLGVSTTSFNGVLPCLVTGVLDPIW